MKYIMGVDIGFRFTGISLFQFRDGKAKLKDVKVIETSKSAKKKQIRAADDDIRRINEITQKFYEFYSEQINNNDEIIVFAEAPTGGALSAKAHRAMGIATAIPAVLFELLKIPVEYVSPNDVKIAVTGKKTASKEEIMNKVCKMVGGEVISHERKTKKKGITHINKYIICDQEFGLNFEHIADSVGAVLHGKKNSTMYRMFTNENFKI